MSFKKILVLFIIVALAGGVFYGYKYYKKVFVQNIFPQNSYVNIPTGSTFEEVKKILITQNIVKDTVSFSWVAKKLNYPSNIHPGHYELVPGMSNKDLVRLLRSGKQTPVEFILNNVRTAPELASRVSSTLEADSISVLKLLHDSLFLKQYGFNPQNCIAMFIPNTYQFYWNTSAKKFVDRMAKEHKIFWNKSREAKAAALGLTPVQVSVLASIVEQETNRNDEKPIVAGVYMNRYKKGWKLEADPTLVFALGNFKIQRVLYEYKQIDSPYNTYMYTGLPPGPICIPSIASIDAVLNYAKHDYMYFCAKEDFSGYHCFAKSYDQHLINARRFQKELNKRKITS